MAIYEMMADITISELADTLAGSAADGSYDGDTDSDVMDLVDFFGDRMNGWAYYEELYYDGSEELDCYEGCYSAADSGLSEESREALEEVRRYEQWDEVIDRLLAERNPWDSWEQHYLFHQPAQRQAMRGEATRARYNPNPETGRPDKTRPSVAGKRNTARNAERYREDEEARVRQLEHQKKEEYRARERERRRERYKNDPDYRAKVLASKRKRK